MIASLALVQACSLGPEMNPENPQSAPYRVQIINEIDQQPATRVAIDDGFCAGDEVGVYMVNYDGETPGVLKVKDNQADNVRFKFSESGEWVSDYDIFYKDNDTKVDFYGYYPLSEPTSIESYAHEVEKDQSKGAENGLMAHYEASDFLWAKTAGVTPTNAKVVLKFKHILSSVRVRFAQGEGWNDAAEYAAATKEVLVTNTIRKSTINLSTGVVTPEGEAPLTGIIPLNDNGDFRAIVVPQTVGAGRTVLTISIDGTPRNFVREVDTEYLPGKMTTFDLTVSKKAVTGEYEILLSGVSVTAWEADNVSHGDDAREYVVIHNAIPGDLGYTVTERLGMDPTKIKNLKLTGSINASDYSYMKSKMTALQRLNLKEVESLIGGRYVIPQNAFSGKTTLSKCLLPEKLERIESGAFESTSLTGSLILPDGLKYVSGFESTKITNVHFPSTLEEIGTRAFSNCNSLMAEISLPQSLRIIGSYAFSSSSISGNLVFPDNLESIGDNAFHECSKLTGSLSLPDKISVISKGSFYYSGFSGILKLPAGLQEIQDDAFYGARLKGELNIPSTVATIGNRAFQFTQFNGNLILPSELISLGSSVFHGCSRLSGVIEIPSSIVAIQSLLFASCTSLEGIILHKDVEVIENNAFSSCSGLNSIVCKAKNPPVIDASSFRGVAKDNFTVEVPEASVTQYRNASNWSEFKRFAAHREFSISRNLFRTLNAAHSKTFVLRAPAGENWSVESKPDWVEISTLSGTGKCELTVSTTALTRGAGNRIGEIVFLLDGKDYRSTMTVEQYDYQYGDGDLITLQEAGTGNGVNIVLLADCFDAKDISEGKYLQAIQDAYGYFFDIEPYLTYKDYFNVYGVFGMSADSGMGTVNTIREARFGSQYFFNGGVSPDFSTTFAAACVAPIDDNVGRTLIVMVENSSDYEGITFMWGDGSAVAIVPMSTDPAPYDFRGLVHHEAGGHGFGKLADEYIYHNAFVQSCGCDCCDHVDGINAMKSYGFYENISLSGNMRDVPWSNLISDPQYSNTVDVYEGAFYHSRGVFRSEPTSCMNNNIPYYNAISRESIVKRIMDYAGESYSFESFRALDKEAQPSVSTKGTEMLSAGEWNSGSQDNQMPPKYMGDKPSFKKTDF